MVVVYFVALLVSVGLAQGSSFNYEPATIEDVRGGSRIVAGWEASDGQIPHQISLRMVGGTGTVSSCGGSIIHHEWVITAAHCLANRDTFVVRIGLTNLTRPEYLVETDRKYIHPNYIELIAGVQTDDIALLGLDRRIPYGPNIQPCRLQNSESRNRDFTDVILTVSGYGRTDDLWNGGAASEILRWVFLRGISNERCLEWYPNSVVIKDETICASYYNVTSQSSCQGDSGGPLTFVDTDGKPTMVGVASFVSSAGCSSLWPSDISISLVGASGDQKAGAYFAQRLSLAIQQGNAASALGTMPHTAILDGYVRPGPYHRWYKEITNIDFDWSDEDILPEPPASEETEAIIY